MRNEIPLLTAAEFKLAQATASLFTPEDDLRTADLSASFVPRWTSLFDGDPIMLPTQEGMPRDLPRAILQSRSGEWRCELSAARATVSWVRSAADAQSPALSEFFTRATQVLRDYSSADGRRIGRFATILKRVAPHPQPGMFLARHFCHGRWDKAPLNRPESFELHAHKRFDFGTFRVNSWVRNRTASLTEFGQAQPVVLVEQDLNTLAEESASKAFSPDEMTDFFSAAADEVQGILEMYYPTRGDPHG